MSWRDGLRPGSFRGVSFEATDHYQRGGVRGEHHVYPARDQGWVEQLGLEDRSFTLEIYVLGDDYMSRREELIAELETPGVGELIHPWLGSIEVVVDPRAGWSERESSRRGRMAQFTVNFLRAPATGEYPSAEADGALATAGAAEDLVAGALDVFGGRIDLAGAAAFLADAQVAFDDAFAALDGVRSVIGGAIALQQGAVGLIFNAVATAQGIYREVISIGDAFSATAALFDAFAGAFRSEARPSSTLSYPGVRPPATRPRRRRERLVARKAATAARLTLDRAPEIADPPPGQRFAANRAAIDAAVEAGLLAELARGLVEGGHDDHPSAIAGLKDFDERVETAIRREGDRLAVAADPTSPATFAAPPPSFQDDGHIARLTTLRLVVRDAVLSEAASLPLIVRRDLGESLPAVAASWRLTGAVAIEQDLIDRNGIDHPLFAPPALDFREAA